MQWSPNMEVPRPLLLHIWKATPPVYPCSKSCALWLVEKYFLDNEALLGSSHWWPWWALLSLRGRRPIYWGCSPGQVFSTTQKTETWRGQLIYIAIYIRFVRDRGYRQYLPTQINLFVFLQKYPHFRGLGGIFQFMTYTFLFRIWKYMT